MTPKDNPKENAPAPASPPPQVGRISGGKELSLPATPLLDQLEPGPWPSFVKGLKRLAKRNTMMRGVLTQLEYSYKTRTGYWKGGTVGVRGYGGGIIARFSMIADKFPEAAEFHTFRVQPPPGMHYTTKVLRELCDIWERNGSGLIALHGQSGDIMLQGTTMATVQQTFDELNKAGWDLGGAGPAMRTSMSCVGPARCEQACYDTLGLHRKVINHFLDGMHRPSYPYKFKFKFPGCPNDCVNSIQRSDFAVIGTWRDAIQIDQKEVGHYIDKYGLDYLVNSVIAMCPTRAIQLKGRELAIDNSNCVRCMHCLNVMTKALSPGKDRGVTLLLGGKRTLKIGDTMGVVIVPFMRMQTEEDYTRFVDLADRIIEFWADNALDHERAGETLERIGLDRFLEGAGLEPHPAMVLHPRTNSYIKFEYDGNGAGAESKRASAAPAAR